MVPADSGEESTCQETCPGLTPRPFLVADIPIPALPCSEKTLLGYLPPCQYHADFRWGWNVELFARGPAEE